MSKKANSTLIGIFVTSCLGLIIFGLFFFGSYTFFTKTEKFILYFEDSVNGLEVGAPVKFKGVEVGQVKDILIRFNQAKDSALIPTIIEITDTEIAKNIKTELSGNRNNPDSNKTAYIIQKGLRGKLIQQSFLTGKIFIELDFYPEEGPPVFFQEGGRYIEIPTINSELDELWTVATNLFQEMSKIDFVEISDHIESIAYNLDKGIQEIQFKEINSSIINAANSFRELKEKLSPMASDAQEFFNDGSNAFKKVGSSFDSIDDMVEDDSSFRYKLENTLDELSHAARSVRNFTDYLERNPRALLTGKKQPNM